MTMTMTMTMSSFLLLPLLSLYLLSFALNCSGHPSFHISLHLSKQKDALYMRGIVLGHGRSDSGIVSFSQLQQYKLHIVKRFLGSSTAPAYSPVILCLEPCHLSLAPLRCCFSSLTGPVYDPSIAPLHRQLDHYHHPNHRRHVQHVVVAPSPLEEHACDQICVEPLTATPFGSPCGCVYPMKVRLLLDVAAFAVFPVLNQLEIEIALGAYLDQSQVKVMGAKADSQNQGKTVVDVNLVPLGEKFDNTTAMLTYKRLWHKRMSLNTTLFGTYEVMYINYPGIPSSPPYPNYGVIGPSENAGGLPNSANFMNKNQKMNPKTAVIIALSAFVLLLLFTGAIFILIRSKKFGRSSSAVGPTFPLSLNKRTGIGSFLSSSIKNSTSVSLTSTMAACMLSVKTFPFGEIERATDKFNSSGILGEGGSGCVYRGIMEDGTEVAVKLLRQDNQNGDYEFAAEVGMLSRLHHRNLVRLIGICIEGQTRCLVYELICNGSVESHLHGADQKMGPLDWDARLKIALGAARGLAYLHEDSNPRVIHRDFKASNVLLEEDFTPKVSDFGLAREATEVSQHISTRVMGTFGYVAPEYAMTGHLLVKSDVYSYGVVLLELLTGRRPVDMSQSPGQENLVTWARPLLTSREGLKQLIDPSLAGSYDLDDIAKVAAIASMCVQPEVTNRPFMGEVVQALTMIYNDTDETWGVNTSEKGSSVPDSNSKGDLAPSDRSWCDAGGLSPRLKYGQASSFITMEYCSAPLENRQFSASSLAGDGLSLPIRHGNRSAPLRTVSSKPKFYRLRRSMSEHGGLLPTHSRIDPYWA